MVALEPRYRDHMRIRLSDTIRCDGEKLGTVGTQRDAPICFITDQLPETVVHQVQLVVAERDAEVFGGSKMDYFQRKISFPPLSKGMNTSKIRETA